MVLYPQIQIFFPYGTLLVNLLGSFLIGFLVGLDSLSISTDWLNRITISGLGGFLQL
ncbi:MAG: hypothetical protein ACK4QL_01605 [Pseudanabaenaceae cyanobacterium]